MVVCGRRALVGGCEWGGGVGGGLWVSAGVGWLCGWWRGAVGGGWLLGRGGGWPGAVGAGWLVGWLLVLGAGWLGM